MRSIIAVLIIATIAVAGFEIGIGTGIQNQIPSETVIPLVAGLKYSQEISGIVIEGRGFGTIWQAGGPAGVETSTGFVGLGFGFEAYNTTLTAGAGYGYWYPFEDRKGDLSEYGPAAYVSMDFKLNELQHIDVIITGNSMDSKPLFAGMIFSIEL